MLVRSLPRAPELLVVAHQVIVLCLRYLLENMTEEQILAIDAAHDVANCGLTSYTFTPDIARDGELQLGTYNFVAPLESAGAPVTTRPDPPVAAR